MILFLVRIDTLVLPHAELPAAPVPKRWEDAAIRCLSDLGIDDMLQDLHLKKAEQHFRSTFLYKSDVYEK